VSHLAGRMFPRSVSVRVTNNAKLNGRIDSIELVSQLLGFYKLFFVNVPQWSPVRGREWIIDFEAPLRLLFHIHT
jgi:hypothetical protein